MIRLFFLNLWSNIKRSPMISLILLLQIVLLSFCLFDILFNQSQSDIINETFQQAYSENTIFKVRPKQEMSRDEQIRASAGFYESVENSGMDSYEDFYEFINQSEDIKSAMLLAGKKTDGDYYHIDQGYIDLFGIIIDSGRLFTENEFTELDPDCVPVLLGYDFKEDYSIGDTLTYNIFGNQTGMTCKVIGFIAQGQVFMDGGRPLLFDGKMIFPYISKSLSDWVEFVDEHKEFTDDIKSIVRYYSAGLGANILSGRLYLIEKGREDLLLDYMNNALQKTGLDVSYVVRSYDTIPARYVADELDEKNVILSLLVIVLTVFSLISIVFSSINNVSNNMRSYAIHSLSGATKLNILMYCVLETFIYCLLGFSTGAVLKYWDFIRNDFSEHPAFAVAKTNIINIGILFVTLACVLSLLFVYFKISRYSIAELIRGRDVKKNKRQPVYKVLFFVIITLVSVCVTFLNSYSYQLKHIDRYQNNLSSDNARLLYLQKLDDENAPEVELFYDVENASDYVVDISVNTVYNEVMAPKVRGWYFEGEYGIPEITEGRFFNSTEITQSVNYAVVGKNALADFSEEKEGKRYIKYSGTEYEIIGVVGRDGHDTTVDDWVFLTLPTVIEKFGCEGRPIIIDGKNESDCSTVVDHIVEMSSGRYTYLEQKPESKLDLGVSDEVLDMFVLMVLIAAIVFCSHYVDQMKQIINIKKLVGFSKFMIFVDTFVQFVSISSVTFIFGNSLLFVASKTVLRNIEFFSAFTFNLTSVAVSFGLVLLLSLFISLMAINRAFKGSARDLKLR